jgi:hypothetical protein
LRVTSKPLAKLWAAVKKVILSRQSMTSISILSEVLTLVPPIGQAALFLQAARRKLLREYSLFIWYTGLQIAKGILYPIVVHHPKTYFVAYWLGELVDIPLVIAVLYQLYSRLFLGFEALQRLQDLLFRWSVAICILTAATTAAATPGTDADRLMAAVLSLDLAASVLKAGLVLFLFLMSSALSLRWTRYAFGILVGMGLYNAVTLATVAARTQFGDVAAVPYGLIKVGAYNCAIVVWLVYFFGRESVPQSVSAVPANNLSAWNQSLMELLTR